MQSFINESPESLRQYFHDLIEHMEAPRLALLRRVLLQLDLVSLADRLDRDFDADRAAGRLTADKIDQAIRAARAAHPYA